MNDRVAILQEAKRRVQSLSFGEPVTNICAGDTNPGRHAYFVEYKVKGYTNRYGIRHDSYYAKCTDRKGKFWLTAVEAIYPGHLSIEKADELFTPVWEAEFGRKRTSVSASDKP